MGVHEERDSEDTGGPYAAVYPRPPTPRSSRPRMGVPGTKKAGRHPRRRPAESIPDATIPLSVRSKAQRHRLRTWPSGLSHDGTEQKEKPVLPNARSPRARTFPWLSGPGTRPGSRTTSGPGGAVQVRRTRPYTGQTDHPDVLPRPQARIETHIGEASATAAVYSQNERCAALDLPEPLSVRPCPVLSEETTGRGSDGGPASPACAGDLMQPGERQSRQGTSARRHYVQLTPKNPESQPGHAPSYAQLIERLFHTRLLPTEKPSRRPGFRDATARRLRTQEAASTPAA